ncbi:EAL domain-containing protein [Vibrio gazogenes]|uniref:cyclic-guanylate-specific phosphodiesterase n=1 Tax=Vibrio gazogenes DSM 21264 = NBRC 103151 TaxID=1123492 RepID=A0A1M5AXZ0_VIBGA|nr:EAL domain-containing protein [Vibrio gazogenes]USP12756.1 EAL domain-containing protein [Vibrio gazogenes]SHF35085.1 sensor c-di-GMP phosphodiesterase, contains CSS-motif sensor and EAL domain [Vibrio gazogenes DSM 21264] [Vibrio gazogenes DSM 21264 = NBRC 103151]
MTEHSSDKLRKASKFRSYVLALKQPMQLVFLTILFLGIFAQMMMTTFHREEMKSIAYLTLSHASQIATQLGEAIQLLADSDTVPCSQEDENLMQDILHVNHFIADIGRIEGGMIQCLVLKKLAHPLQLPNAQYMSNGYSFVKNYPFESLPHHVLIDLTFRDNVIAMTAPRAFEGFDISTNYTVEIRSSNLKHVFERLGDTTLSGIKPDGRLSSLLIEKQCHHKPSICVLVRDNHPFFYHVLNGPILIAFVVVILFILLSYKVWGIPASQGKQLKSRLRKAITHRQLSLVYQPKFVLRDERVQGFEVLCRWHDSLLGTISPEVFIPLAEQTKQIRQLTLFVIEQSIQDMARVLQQYPEYTLSINLAVDEYLNKAFIERVSELVKKYSVNVNQIMFEITERSSFGCQDVVSVCDTLRMHHFRVSLDDFGTGYSNLSWLSDIYTDEIKIDRMFTSALGTDTIAGRTVNMMLDLLEGFEDVTIVLEGIETLEQVEYLRKRDIEVIGQGWYYARAMPIEEVKAFIHRHSVRNII